ncbi:MAG: alpha-amylase family glycosyl hydrolase [Planctomycetia bacterium]|nr:alpha-amylase family glycosyl hydrolase [Planctomycetia bacterium]
MAKNSLLFFLSFLLCGASMLFAAEAKKPTSFHDQNARKAPDWVTRGVIYQINPRAFTPEGTLAAATKRLPEMKRLGVTIAYLIPVFVSDDDPRQEFWSKRQKKSGQNNPRNPYRMKDYYHIDPEYGTDADLKAFVDEAHRLGMRVMLDLVYLHCGPTAVFIKSHPDFVKRDKDGNIVNAAWSFPGLNFESPALREYLWKNMEYWIAEFGVDGYRTDVADGIPLDFWTEGRRRIEKMKPDAALFAEGINRIDDQLYAYDLNYGFPFFSALRNVMDKGNPVSELSDIKRKIAAVRPKGARLVHYFDNHDISNDDYELRRETRWGFEGVNAVLTMCMTLDGVPMLYNGQEIADKTRNSIFGNLAIDWNQGKTTEGKKRFALCQELIKLRLAHPALVSPEITFVNNDEKQKVLSYERNAANEQILVVVNLRNERVRVKVQSELTHLEPLFVNGKQLAQVSKPIFDLPPYGWFVGKAVK